MREWLAEAVPVRIPIHIDDLAKSCDFDRGKLGHRLAFMARRGELVHVGFALYRRPA
jgi:hypothetical protein